MKVAVIYRPNSEHGRLVEEFIHDYQARHDASRMEIYNVDERAGAAMANLYDVMQYPTILALRDDGSIVRSWEGGTLPLMDELASYAYA